MWSGHAKSVGSFSDWRLDDVDCLGRQALVIGAGMSGLAAAGALAKHFEQVTVAGTGPARRSRLRIDRARRNRRQLHGLLSGGLRRALPNFPGLDRDLAAAGAVPHPCQRRPP